MQNRRDLELKIFVRCWRDCCKMEDIIFSAKQVQGKKALFGKGRFALQNVDFELPSGYIMGIIGENGAGKTTFFRYIMEEKKHYRGSFYLDGTDIAEDHAWSMNRIGFVSEERLFLRQKSARENARMLGSFYDTFDMDQFAALMEQMDLTTARTVEKMSRGENMKFQLAFALAHKPRLLLLDEPFSALDTFLKWNLELELADLLADFPGPILWVSHDLGECYRNCKTVCVMENGRSGAGTDMQALVLHPATQDAARLAGCRNFLPAHRCAEGVQLDGRALTLPLQAETEQVTIAVPDSAVTLHTGPYSAVVSRVIRDLDASIVLLRPEHQNTPLLRTALPKNAPAEPGQTIRFDLRPEACLCYPSEQARSAAFK